MVGAAAVISYAINALWLGLWPGVASFIGAIAGIVITSHNDIISKQFKTGHEGSFDDRMKRVALSAIMFGLLISFVMGNTFGAVVGGVAGVLAVFALFVHFFQ